MLRVCYGKVSVREVVTTIRSTIEPSTAPLARMGDSTVTAAAKQPEVPRINAPLVCERSSASPPKRAARSRGTPARGSEPQAPEAPPPSTIELVCYRVLNARWLREDLCIGRLLSGGVFLHLTPESCPRLTPGRRMPKGRGCPKL